jgi:transcription elongation factor GreB
LWHEERPRVTQAVAEAAAQGDRSENAEYTYGKKRLHEIDRRVRFLRKRLDGMTVVDPLAAGRRDSGRVYFGAWVQVEEPTGERRWHRIVGPDEFDMADDYISMDSPLGKSLMGKRLDDDVTVPLPTGAKTLTITDIRYGSRPDDS